MRRSIITILSFLLSISVTAQWNDWKDAKSVKKLLLKAQETGKSYFSQFHEYDVRGKDIYTSIYRDKTGEIPYIYGLDFYYGSGTYFPEEYKQKLRRNIIEVVRKQWKENKAIPSFSWHLENPYVTHEFGKYMGCTYRYGQKDSEYPEKHRFVINEILTNNGGETCGLGSYQPNNDVKISYANSKEWFDARCLEIAEIINEFVDDDGRPIPLIFRLWHECEDTWMWWGKQSVSIEDYREFFIYTETNIQKHAPEAEILWAYCPDRYWETEEEFMCRYPGDTFVDIIGYDDYSIGNPDKKNSVVKKAILVSECARKRGKVAALFETANKTESTSDIFLCDYLIPLMKNADISLGLVQIWNSGVFDTEAQFEDRRQFLKSTNILIIDTNE